MLVSLIGLFAVVAIIVHRLSHQYGWATTTWAGAVVIMALIAPIDGRILFVTIMWVWAIWPILTHSFTTNNGVR